MGVGSFSTPHLIKALLSPYLIMWFKRNLKTLLGIIYFFTSTCGVYITLTEYMHIKMIPTVLFVMLHIIIFALYISVYRYEIDNNVNLYAKSKPEYDTTRTEEKISITK